MRPVIEYLETESANVNAQGVTRMKAKKKAKKASAKKAKTSKKAAAKKAKPAKKKARAKKK